MDARTRTCRDCRTAFTIRPDRIAFYRGRGLKLPVRCGLCRKERRFRAAERAALANNQNGPGRDDDLAWR
jgi:RNase P subunit RPR2